MSDLADFGIITVFLLFTAAVFGLVFGWTADLERRILLLDAEVERLKAREHTDVAGSGRRHHHPRLYLQ
jgi:hypothetical protein